MLYYNPHQLTTHESLYLVAFFNNCIKSRVKISRIIVADNIVVKWRQRNTYIHIICIRTALTWIFNLNLKCLVLTNSWANFVRKQTMVNHWNELIVLWRTGFHSSMENFKPIFFICRNGWYYSYLQSFSETWFLNSKII